MFIEMKKFINIFVELWNDTDPPSKEDWNSYHEWIKNHPGKDRPLPPINGRGMMIVSVFVIAFVILLLYIQTRMK